jgi:hypothetical protein
MWRSMSLSITIVALKFRLLILVELPPGEIIVCKLLFDLKWSLAIEDVPQPSNGGSTKGSLMTSGGNKGGNRGWKYTSYLLRSLCERISTLPTDSGAIQLGIKS